MGSSICSNKSELGFKIGFSSDKSYHGPRKLKLPTEVIPMKFNSCYKGLFGITTLDTGPHQLYVHYLREIHMIL
jgi:hypothetical protein